MNGKGSKLRTGANLNAYWNNFPFPEKLTVTQWISKFGDTNVDMNSFKNISIGSKITEDVYLRNVKYLPEIDESSTKEFIFHNLIADKNGDLVPAPWSAAYSPDCQKEYVLTTDELEELKTGMGSMSFSEFKKIVKK